MAAKIVIPTSVSTDIKAAGDYLVEQDAPEAALRLVEALEAKIMSLASLPTRGASYGTLYRRVFVEPYQIIYSVEETLVYIRMVRRMSRQRY